MIDLLDPAAPAAFAFRPYLLHIPVRETDPATNPVYSATRLIADRVRAHPSRPEGLLAPSVRTPPVGTFQPAQLVLDPFPASAGLPRPLAARAVLHAQLLLTLEFLDPAAGAPAAASASSARIDWARPRFRLDPIVTRGRPRPAPAGGTIPPAAGRPGGAAIVLGAWQPVDIKYD